MLHSSIAKNISKRIYNINYNIIIAKYKLYTESHCGDIEEQVGRSSGGEEIGTRKSDKLQEGRSAIDNIFVLNHIVQKEKIKRNKVYAMFVDLKAAFDNVDRTTLWRILRDRGINERLIRAKRIHEEIEVIIRTKKGYTQMLWTKKSIRQGMCDESILI